MNVLVTGASGYIGSALVPLLLAAGHRVRVITRHGERIRQRPWHAAVEVMEGDLADSAVCNKAVSNIEALVHVAGLAHANAAARDHEQENLINTGQLAVAAQQHGVSTFVFVSSCKANYPQHSHYGRYKRESEEFLLNLKGPMRVVCLRPGIVYGDGMSNNLNALLRVLRRPWLPVFIGSSNPIGMVSLQDCCRSLVAALTIPALHGRCWELTDGTSYTLDALVRGIRAYYALPEPAWHPPRFLVKLLCLAYEPVAKVIGSHLGLRTYKAIYEECYAPDLAFAKVSNTMPTTDFYAWLRDNKR